ncbi:MAG: VWA domain-containing protein, partial [Clostridiales bacterium]|nr:VWA domain-containing protein [Clostridiales bacterium]
MPLKSFFYLLILCLSIPLIKPPHISAAERQPQFLDIYPMTADPRTDRFVEYFSSSTLENGRIWVDKTVNNETITFYDIHGEELQTIMSRPDDFLVTLSALSQSYSIETVTEPTDAVFVLDVSASMDVYRLGGDSRAAVMVRALNSAIHSLMQANPANRVAVVAYGGSTGSMRTNISKVYTPLILGHYAISGDQYFSITGNNIRVSAEINPLFTPDRSVPVAGSTPTQRGIYEG